MIDGYATFSHYLDHLAPIWLGLPDDVRGDFQVYDAELVPYAAMLGIEARYRTVYDHPERLLLVAGGHDLTHQPGRRHILMEHGAGQTYLNAAAGWNGYAGGVGRESVELFICPARRVADANLAVYPDARAVVVGSPRLDPWLNRQRERSPAGDRPRVVVSTHWNGGAKIDESLSAWPEYRRHYSTLDGNGSLTVSKHAHPRWADHIRRDLPDLPFIESFDEVLATADLYVCDNSSTQYETAALGIPNVVVNSTMYRRDVHHGLRFWSHIPGPQVDDPDHLAATVREVLDHPDQWADYARRVANDVYDGLLDGHATERAVGAILDLHETSQVPVP